MLNGSGQQVDRLPRLLQQAARHHRCSVNQRHMVVLGEPGDDAGIDEQTARGESFGDPNHRCSDSGGSFRRTSAAETGDTVSECMPQEQCRNARDHGMGRRGHVVPGTLRSVLSTRKDCPWVDRVRRRPCRSDEFPRDHIACAEREQGEHRALLYRAEIELAPVHRGSNVTQQFDGE